MPQSQTLYGAPLAPDQRPRCPICQTEMWLARTAPGRLKMELHTFECVSCGHVHKELVAADNRSYPEALGFLFG
jgi:RNase P subunit RPR2